MNYTMEQYGALLDTLRNAEIACVEEDVSRAQRHIDRAATIISRGRPSWFDRRVFATKLALNRWRVGREKVRSG